MKNTKKYLLVGLTIIVGGAVLYYIVHIAVDIYTTAYVINAQVVQRSDYTKITTPLSTDVVADLCTKFNLSSADQHCQSGAVVYGPDFFKI